MRFENAGENKVLDKRCDSVGWKLDVEFEHAARAMPQQNSLAETSFTTRLKP